MFAAAQGLFKVVRLQVIAAVLGAALGGAMFGATGALSAASGGVAVIVPTWLFALRLTAAGRRSGGASPLGFMLGELIKLLSCVALLAAVRLVYPDVHWGALVIGLVVTLQANFFAFLIRT